MCNGHGKLLTSLQRLCINRVSGCDFQSDILAEKTYRLIDNKGTGQKT